MVRVFKATVPCLFLPLYLIFERMQPQRPTPSIGCALSYTIFVVYLHGASVAMGYASLCNSGVVVQ
jgi:hypothetical protein